MKLSLNKVGRVVATAALCGATLGIVGCGGGGDAGKAAFETKCVECHDLTTVENAASNYTSEADWKDLVKTMQNQSTNISDEDAAAIAAYLATKTW